MSMKTEMYREAVELLGRGYVPDYYEQAASGFISIAEHRIGSLSSALDELVKNSELAGYVAMTDKNNGLRKALREAKKALKYVREDV